MARNRAQRGSYALEFALCLPIWIAVMGGIMDFGWLLMHQAALDQSANIGCRAGSLVDPGFRDEFIGRLESAAEDGMVEFLDLLGNEDCDGCFVDASTIGDWPARSLQCDAGLDVRSLSGLFYDQRTLTTIQLARLEWQHEAAP